MKFCKDCRHCRPDNNHWLLALPVIGWIVWVAERIGQHHLIYAKCARMPSPDADNDHLITGRPRRERYYFCSTARVSDCGADAKLFEVKP